MDAEVDFYWRPGCPFCPPLEFALRKRGITLNKHDIWADDEARAFVRSVANGHETVPTVVVDGEAMVNPPVRRVVEALTAAGATLVEPTGVAGLLARLLGG